MSSKFKATRRDIVRGVAFSAPAVFVLCACLCPWNTTWKFEPKHSITTTATTTPATTTSTTSTTDNARCWETGTTTKTQPNAASTCWPQLLQDTGTTKKHNRTRHEDAGHICSKRLARQKTRSGRVIALLDIMNSIYDELDGRRSS